MSYGRFYGGPRVSTNPYREGMEPPVIFWVPAIAPSGLVFYTGDRFPNWKNNLFVGGMRQGEVPRSGQLKRIDFNNEWEELHRESMLRDLHSVFATCVRAPTDCSTCSPPKMTAPSSGSNRRNSAAAIEVCWV